MKNNILKKLWVFACFIGFTIYGQTTITGLKKNYTQSMDSLLLNVNKQPLTTGILHERVMNFANLDALKANGAITTSNFNHFLQSWSELYRAAYNPTFISSDNLKNNLNTNNNINLVDIGIINTKMNVIKSGNANTPSLKFENGRFVNILGVNPFTENQVTVIAALKETITSNYITFRLQSSFMLQLLGKKIKNLQADFGTGATYNLITNQILTATNPTVAFTTNGEKEFVFTVIFDDNTTQTLKAKMNVNFLPIEPDGLRSGSFPAEENFVGINSITATIPFQGYNETNSSNGTLEYRTYYNTVSNLGYNVATNTFSVQPKIRKTVIILDGFDPGDGRKTYPGSNGYKFDKSSLEELMLYKDETGVNRNLVQKLRSAPYGFDVTLVNFPKGADYVERNAMAVVALLQRENAKLTTNGSTEQISIVGPSMGGLVARYALAYMEKNNIPHNTKLFVSFDSPHLGANIPISTQENLYFYGYYGEKEKAKQKFDENFRSPAARQMLTEQLDGIQQEAPYTSNLWFNGFNGQNDNTRFRNLFKANLASNGLPNSNGFPQNLRKIAILNGTGNGTKTNYAEGFTCLKMEGFRTIKWAQIFGTSVTTTLKVVTLDDRFLSTPNNWSQTFSGKVTFPGKLGQIFGTNIPGPPSVITGVSSRRNINPRGTMDVVQGGLFETMDIIQTEFTTELSQLVLDGDLTSYNWPINLHKHTFIPSVSALAFKNSNFDWSTAFNRNLVCDPANKEIPFDSYFIPPTNEDHVKVTSANANWLIQELIGKPQAPYFPLEENLIRGNPVLCNDKIETYTIHDICKTPSPVKYTNQASVAENGWSVEGNLVILSSTPYTVTVKGTSDVLSDGKIIATYQNGLQSIKLVKIGIPVVANQTINGGSAYVSMSSTDGFSLSTPVAGATNYRWFITYLSTDPSCGCTTNSDGFVICPPNVIRPKFLESGSTTYNTPSTGVYVNWGNCPGMYLITCIAENDCGSTQVNIKNIVVVNPSGGGGGSGNPCPGYRLQVYPNPVKTGIIEINIAIPNDPCFPAEGYRTINSKQNDVKIYDMFGLMVYSNKYKDDNFTISNLNLKKGNYILHVDSEKGGKLKEIIIIE